MPTCNFSVAVDDSDMGIAQVFCLGWSHGDRLSLDEMAGKSVFVYQGEPTEWNAEEIQSAVNTVVAPGIGSPLKLIGPEEILVRLKRAVGHVGHSATLASS